LITLYVFAALAGAIAYFVAARLKVGTRIAIALMVFFVPCAVLTALVMAAGDKASPDAITVNLH